MARLVRHGVQYERNNKREREIGHGLPIGERELPFFLPGISLELICLELIGLEKNILIQELAPSPRILIRSNA